METVYSKAPTARHARSFRLFPRPPFRLDLTVWVLRREPANRLDRWDGATYRRTVAREGALFEASVRQSSGPGSPSLEVDLRADNDQPDLETIAARALNRLLGLEVDLSEFYRFAAARRELADLVERFHGVKPPRFLSLFEALANGIIFQQVSLPSGTALLNHLVETCGPALPGSTGRAFPRPETLAGLAPEDFRPLGVSRQKGKALIELAARAAGGLDLEQVEAMSDDEALAFLCGFRGVGRWTAQYSLLRGLGRLHVFPGDDVGARNKVRGWLGLDHVPDYQGMLDISSGWRPYGGMVYFHLLLNHLAEKEYIT